MAASPGQLNDVSFLILFLKGSVFTLYFVLFQVQRPDIRLPAVGVLHIVVSAPAGADHELQVEAELHQDQELHRDGAGSQWIPQVSGRIMVVIIMS